jgi:hypothetical protein
LRLARHEKAGQRALVDRRAILVGVDRVEVVPELMAHAVVIEVGRADLNRELVVAGDAEVADRIAQPPDVGRTAPEIRAGEKVRQVGSRRNLTGPCGL